VPQDAPEARASSDSGDFQEAMRVATPVRVAVSSAAEVAAVRDLAMLFGGHAQVTCGDDALRADPFGPPPPGALIMRRIRAAFDPAGVMCPGRFAASAPVPA
jgi:hypothetical protein